MKTLAWNRLAWIALLPLAAFAGVRDDYARQWPLTLSNADAGAYRVVLDRAVYQQLQSPSLKDLVVSDAEGTPVAAALFDAEQPIAKAAGTKRVPWFPLPGRFEPQPPDIASISEIGADGSLRRVILSDDTQTSEKLASEFLIDISSLREPVQALQVTWADEQESFDREYLVTASDDLKHWRTVQGDAHMIELRNQGERIVRNRIEFERVQAKYLRLQPTRCRDYCDLQLIEVFAEPASVVAQSWQWEDVAGKAVEGDDGNNYYQYEIKGRFPFERADLLLAGNSTNEWRLESRDALKEDWKVVAPRFITFQLEGPRARSLPHPLDGVHRDHYWRLQSIDGPVSAVPTLRLSYRPEVVMFLAQGKPPYALLAGSARASRTDAPLAQLLDALRAQRGQEWQPATTLLGKAEQLAGEGALTPAPVQRDWKSWLLWALLVGGALIVAGFAFSLLKKPGGQD